jgi:hypothetical protein
MSSNSDQMHITLQRLEGAALLGVCLFIGLVVFPTHKLGFFMGLILVDISMFGYLEDLKIGAIIYNIGHSIILPFLLAVFALWQQQDLLGMVAVGWLAHIGLDRTLGFGFKYADSFKHTHLGHIGRK